MNVAGRVRKCGGTIAALLAAALLAPLACGPGSQAKSSAAGGVAAFTPPAPGSRPTIVFIMVDTLRADALGAYGQPDGVTPRMDRIAAEGALFERAISPAPWTLPSIASLITGYLPCVHHATSYRQVEDMDQGRQAAVPVLDESFATLAEFLQQQNYQTAGFCANKFIKAEYGFAQGFEHYDTSFSGNTVQGSQVNAAALAWLGENRDDRRPLFLYLHYMDVHGPYDAAPEFTDPLVEAVAAKAATLQPMPAPGWRGINAYIRRPPAWAEDSARFERLRNFREYWVARYQAGVAEMDHYLGQMIDELKARGLWDDALVVLASDHGESLAEHRHARGHYWEHGYTQYQTEVQVPLLLRWPGVIPAGQRISATAGTIGVMPTLLELLGSFELDESFRAASLVGHLTGAPRATTVLSSAQKAGPPTQAVTRDEWKLILTQGSDEVRIEQFDLDSNPAETRNLYGTATAAYDMLVAASSEFRRYCEDPPVLITPQVRQIGQEEMWDLATQGYTGAVGETDEVDSEPPASQPSVKEPEEP